MNLALILFTFTFGLTLNAATFKIAEITSDIDQDLTEYFVETTDMNQIDSLRYTTTLPNGSILKDVHIPVERIIEEGVVVYQTQGRDVIIISLRDFSTSQGGTLVLNYLFNGITGRWKEKKFYIKPLDGRFYLFEDDNLVNNMHMKSHRLLLLGVIGVKKILTSFE